MPTPKELKQLIIQAETEDQYIIFAVDDDKIVGYSLHKYAPHYWWFLEELPKHLDDEIYFS